MFLPVVITRKDASVRQACHSSHSSANLATVAAGSIINSYHSESILTSDRCYRYRTIARCSLTLYRCTKHDLSIFLAWLVCAVPSLSYLLVTDCLLPWRRSRNLYSSSEQEGKLLITPTVVPRTPTPPATTVQAVLLLLLDSIYATTVSCGSFVSLESSANCCHRLRAGFDDNIHI